MSEQLEEANRAAQAYREQMMNYEGNRGALEDSYEELQEAYYEACEQADRAEHENAVLRQRLADRKRGLGDLTLGAQNISQPADEPSEKASVVNESDQYKTALSKPFGESKVAGLE